MALVKLILLWMAPLLAWCALVTLGRLVAGTRYLPNDIDWLFLMLGAAFVAVNPLIGRVESPHVHLLASVIAYVIWLYTLMFVAVWSGGVLFKEHL